MSRSPKTTIAAVRGIGVAVITRRSGSAPPGIAVVGATALGLRAAPPAARRRTGAARRSPRRRASGTAPPRSAARACRPPRRPPRSQALVQRASARPPAVRLVSSATATGRSPAEPAAVGDLELRRAASRTPRKCCSASTSVGDHQGALVAALHGREQRRPGRRRSCPTRRRPAGAGASGSGPARSANDLAQRRPLGVGQLEGQRGEETLPPACPRRAPAGTSSGDTGGGCRGRRARGRAGAGPARAGAGTARRRPAGAGPALGSSIGARAGGCRGRRRSGPTRASRRRHSSGSGSARWPARSSASVIQAPSSQLAEPGLGRRGVDRHDPSGPVAGPALPSTPTRRSTTGFVICRRPGSRRACRRTGPGSLGQLLGPPRLVEEDDCHPARAVVRPRARPSARPLAGAPARPLGDLGRAPPPRPRPPGRPDRPAGSGRCSGAGRA